ncbi:hypothetical protein K443DRAFT_452370 [Laccaria amethystina LaAM-08-1]|uniref:Uncharacterized protein n=1 Tax=Laccaria amethystina LaAM-08-1 TaxID=1095629 RepID=A0A0C9YFS6_9AGAR|nr:hypothetical protein K443DRAFT_452370 [Laccaria amethystina LaAM-08-1]
MLFTSLRRFTSGSVPPRVYMPLKPCAGVSKRYMSACWTNLLNIFPCSDSRAIIAQANENQACCDPP